jgi:hypothetical protein
MGQPVLELFFSSRRVSDTETPMRNLLQVEFNAEGLEDSSKRFVFLGLLRKLPTE